MARLLRFLGDSKWITGVKARTYAHRLRSWYDAILVGRETVAQDDPSLTVRLVEGKNPLRIILDSKASLPLERKVFTDGAADTLLVVTPQALQEKVRAFADLPGVSVLTAAEGTGMWIFLTSCSNLPKRCDQRPCRRRQRYPWSFL